MNMEIQHQIYLLVAVFGGVCALLLVLIIVLGIFVRNLRNSIKEQEPARSINYGFEHDTTSRNITNDDLRSMKSEAINRRPPQKSNLSTKPRNDDSSRHQSNLARPHQKEQSKRSHQNGPPPDRNDPGQRKQRQYSEPSDSAFDNEINNMFDIDDYDDDEDSVVSTDRNYNRSHQGQQQQQGRMNHGGPPPPPSGGQNNNRNRGNNPPPGMNRGPPGGGPGGPRSMYSGNPHESKTYFNERGMNYY